MSFKPFYITSFDESSGLQSNVEPFLIPEKAFQQLDDAVCWRSKILSRPGVKHLARLRRQLKTITLTDDFAVVVLTHNVPDFFNDAAVDLRNDPVGIKETYAEIEPGSVVITVGAISFADTNKDGILIGNPVGNSGTINYVTGEINLTVAVAFGAPTPVVVTLFYFPSLPVMGLQRRERAEVNDEESLAFDRKYAYKYISPSFIELTAPGTTWSGADWQLFWCWNYYIKAKQRLYWVTNNKTASADPMRYYDGTSWTSFAPVLNAAGDTLLNALILISYHDRLIAMNVTEKVAGTSITYVNKIRWSWRFDPTDATGWLEDTVGKGGYLYVTTNEAIVSANFIRDQLIVKFERSSYRLLYTGNQNLPFVFQKINTDLGCESPFSLITFDRGVLAVGDKAITIDDSQNVSRIDMKIPDIVFSISNADQGMDRVYGVRDFSSELVYWAYTDSVVEGEVTSFPNKVLVYNYMNETWAQFNDSFTCYGYYQKEFGYTWEDYTEENDIWENADFPWNSGSESTLFPDVVAGNQDGFVSIVTPLINHTTANDKTLQLFNISNLAGTTVFLVPNHNLQTGQFIKFTGILGSSPSGDTDPTTLNNQVFRVIRKTKDLIALEVYVNSSFELLWKIYVYDGVYGGAGTVTILNRFDIWTKQFSPFYQQAAQCRLGYVDFFTSKTDSGLFTADVYIDTNDLDSVNQSLYSASNTGTNIVSTAPENLTLIPAQANQSKIWHRMYVQTICQNFTLQLHITDEQMMNTDLNPGQQGLSLHAMALYLSQNARLVQ